MKAFLCVLAFLCPCIGMAEVRKLDKAEVSLKGQTLQDAMPALEALLGKRVILDNRAKEENINLQTAIPLGIEEQKPFAEMNVQAAGCVMIETPSAFFICMRQDRAEVLGTLEEREGREVAKVVRQYTLQFADVVDALEMLRQYGEDGGGGGVIPKTSTGSSGKMGENYHPASAMHSSATQTLGSSSSMPLSTMEPSVSEGSVRLQTFRIDGAIVTGDPVSRQIIVEGTSRQVDRMMAALKLIDIQPEQIVLTAIIGEYTLTNNQTVGVDWMNTLQRFNPTAPAGTGFAFAGLVKQSPGAVVDTSTLTNAAALSGGSAGLSLFLQFGQNLSALVTALETDNRFKVIQRPTISTVNHTMAQIFIGQQIAIAGNTLSQGGTTTTNTSIASTTQYIPVRLQLDITPHIFASGQIKLEFTEQHNDVSGYSTIAGNQVPNISEQGLRNTLIVADGSSVMLGGLITTSTTKNYSGLPVISRIPVLRVLFGKKTDGTEKREILISWNHESLPFPLGRKCRHYGRPFPAGTCRGVFERRQLTRCGGAL